MNFGSQNSRGTAILFKSKHEIINCHCSTDSRIQLLNMKIYDQVLTILDIYAPNNASDSDRKTFFSKINKWIDQYALNEEKMILGGDFNFTEDKSIARHTNNNFKDVSATTYKNLITTKALHDIWRKIHHNKKQFTYKDISRLDRFLIFTELLDNAQKADIHTPGIKSDHTSITMNLNFDSTK